MPIFLARFGAKRGVFVLKFLLFLTVGLGLKSPARYENDIDMEGERAERDEKQKGVLYLELLINFYFFLLKEELWGTMEEKEKCKNGGRENKGLMREKEKEGITGILMKIIW